MERTRTDSEEFTRWSSAREVTRGATTYVMTPRASRPPAPDPIAELDAALAAEIDAIFKTSNPAAYAPSSPVERPAPVGAPDRAAASRAAGPPPDTGATITLIVSGPIEMHRGERRPAAPS